jgi:hypothetical protein
MSSTSEYNKLYYKKNKKQLKRKMAEYREEHREELNKQAREWYQDNKKYVREYQKNNQKHIDALVAKRRLNKPENFLLSWARSRAKKFSLPFNLEVQDIVVPKFCPVLGFKLKIGKRGNMTAPSLDRIKPELGYTKGNVAVISRRANWLKNDATLCELKALVKYLEKKDNK